MSFLLMLTFFLILGYINSISIPMQFQQIPFDPDAGDVTSDIMDNKILVKQMLQNSRPNNNCGGGGGRSTNDACDNIDRSDLVFTKRNENLSNQNNNKNSNYHNEERLDYPKYLDYGDSKCIVDCKLLDEDIESIMQKYKLMQHILTSLGPNYFDSITASSLNSSGRRQGPLYAEEPKYVVIPEEDDDERLDLNGFKDFFIPPRGRKHMPWLQKIKNHYELFVPNRGKKTVNIKKDKIKDIFKYNDLFFPNRGKKSDMTSK